MKQLFCTATLVFAIAVWVRADSGAIPPSSQKQVAAGNRAQFNMPYGITVDHNGNLYVADTFNDTIRKITPDGAVTTLAGSAGKDGSTDGKGSKARFFSPTGIAVDGNGIVYVTDNSNYTIRRITPDGEVTTLAGSPGQQGGNDGVGSEARFFFPYGIAVDTSNNLYVTDSIAIRKITPAGMVTTFAGNPVEKGSSDGIGSGAEFALPYGIAVDGKGTLFVTDYTNYNIRRITPDGAVTTLAGSAGVSGSSDGVGNAAQFYRPTGIAVDSNGNLYVVDFGNNTLRKITPDGGVTTVAGSAGVSGSSDGMGSAALFSIPRGVAADGNGNVYVTDAGNNTIRKVTSDGGVMTLAGVAGQGGSNDGTVDSLERPVGTLPIAVIDNSKGTKEYATASDAISVASDLGGGAYYLKSDCTDDELDTLANSCANHFILTDQVRRQVIDAYKQAYEKHRAEHQTPTGQN